MNLAGFAAHLSFVASTMQGVLRNIGEQIGEDAVRHAKEKLGEYQPAAGFFPSWAPLAESTLAEKERLGFPTPSPLLRGGDLRESIGYFVDAPSPARVVVTIYSTSEYAPVQEMGGGHNNIPPRPFLGPVPFERGDTYRDLTGMMVVAAIMPGFSPRGLRKLSTRLS